MWIRPDSRKSVRSFKGIICDDISEFDSYMASHAVVLSQVRSPAIVMHPLVYRPNTMKPLFAWTHSERKEDNEMNEDVFNGSIRKFLKTLGVSAQRDIEKAVRQALAEGKLKGNEKFPATGTISLGGIGLSHEIKGEIELE